MVIHRPPELLLNAALVAVALLDVWVNVDTDEPLRLGCALGAACVLLLRQRWPWLTFVLTLPSVLFSDAVFATLAALYTLASLTRHRSLLAFCALAFTVGDMIPWPSASIDLSKAGTLITLGYTAATAAAPVFLGQLVQTRRDLSLRLTEISQARDHEQRLTAQTVLAQERAQLAREATSAPTIRPAATSCGEWAPTHTREAAIAIAATTASAPSRRETNSSATAAAAASAVWLLGKDQVPHGRARLQRHRVQALARAVLAHQCLDDVVGHEGQHDHHGGGERHTTGGPPSRRVRHHPTSRPERPRRGRHLLPASGLPLRQDLAPCLPPRSVAAQAVLDMRHGAHGFGSVWAMSSTYGVRAARSYAVAAPDPATGARAGHAACHTLCTVQK